jgi:hypothetical protein
MEGDTLIEGQFPDDKEALKIKLDAAREAFGRAERQVQELKMQLGSEMTALQTAIDKYTDKIKESFDGKTAILQLRAHIKDNILHYLQAIWRSEQPDQRFFRLYKVKVPVFEVDNANVQLDIVSKPANVVSRFMTMGDHADFRKFTCGTMMPPSIKWDKFAKLVEVADIESPLGFKGNYVIFPLRPEYSNPLIHYMMQDYVVIEDIIHASDPDQLANFTSEELVEIIRCIYERDPSAITDEVRKEFKEMLLERLRNPHTEKEQIVIPTDALYIDTLPGVHPVLEDFKLIHRAVDVKKAQAAVRQDELKNILRVVRIMKDKTEEPTVDKRIVVEGTSSIDIDPDN